MTFTPHEKDTSRVTRGAFFPSVTFEGGYGYSPYHVDCLMDPCNLAPAVDITMRALSDKFAQVRGSRPVVILIGEIHSVAMHVAFTQAIIERCRMDYPWINKLVADELPHNRLGSYVYSLGDALVEEDIAQILKYRSSEYDPLGRAANLQAARKDLSFSPATNRNYYLYCHRSGLSTLFNDAARDITAENNSVLDMMDPVTRRAASDLDLSGSDGPIDALSSEGMAIRNKVMAELGVKKARETKAALIIQRTGFAHVAGVEGESDFNYSLSQLYEEAGACVLPVFLTCELEQADMNLIPLKGRGILSSSVIADGLSEEEFYSRSHAKDENLPFAPGEEKAYLEANLANQITLNEDCDRAPEAGLFVEEINKVADRVRKSRQPSYA